MNGFWARFGKRGFDILISLVLLAILWPVLLLVAFFVRVKLGSPILFTQQRLGKNAVEFKIFKFRTMTNRCSPGGGLLPDEKRLTRFGKILRSSSLDELPQILNVLSGEMSFIGPRATLPSYKALLLERYPERFLVLPGISSLPAVRGRNSLSWDEKFSLDVEYVKNFGFKMDAYIFIYTVPTVLGRKGITESGSVTASRYDESTKGKG